MTSPTFTWVRAAQQSRSQRTLERLLDATEILLEDRPFDAISVQQIVKAAKSSIGSFYARFDDKDALLQTLHQRFCADVVETSKQFLSTETEVIDLRALLGVFCELMLSDIRQRPGLRRAFLIARPLNEHFQARTHAVDAHLINTLVSVVEPVRDEIAHNDLHAAVSFAFETANALAEYRLLYGVEQDYGASFHAAMVHSLHSYLTQSPS